MRLAVLAVLLAACGGEPADPDGAVDPAPDAEPPYPPPRTDVVPRLGSDGAVDIATWNIENFPKNVATPEHVADLVASMDIDLLAVQEIEDVTAFDELVARLRGYDGALSTHTYGDGTYQKIGFVYRRSLLAVTDPVLLLTGNGYELPRPPMQVTVVVAPTGVDFTAVTLHMKAGFDTEDRDRRAAAVELLDQLIAGDIAGGADPDVVLLGDFNEVVTSASGREALAPLLDDPASYDFRTEDLASGGAYSFVPSEVMLDHVVTTTALGDELAGGDVEVAPLDVQFLGYRQTVSDHLPVVLSMPID